MSELLKELEYEALDSIHISVHCYTKQPETLNAAPWALLRRNASAASYHSCTLSLSLSLSLSLPRSLDLPETALAWKDNDQSVGSSGTRRPSLVFQVSRAINPTPCNGGFPLSN